MKLKARNPTRPAPVVAPVALVPINLPLSRPLGTFNLLEKQLSDQKLNDVDDSEEVEILGLL